MWCGHQVKSEIIKKNHKTFQGVTPHYILLIVLTYCLKLSNILFHILILFYLTYLCKKIVLLIFIQKLSVIPLSQSAYKVHLEKNIYIKRRKLVSTALRDFIQTKKILTVPCLRFVSFFTKKAFMHQFTIKCSLPPHSIYG